MEAAYRKLAQTKTPSVSADWEATVLPQPGGILYGATDKPGKAAPLWQSQVQSGFEGTASGLLNLEKIAAINTLKEISDIENGVKPRAGPKSIYRSMSLEQRDQVKQQLSAKVVRLASEIGQSREYVNELPANPAVKKFSTAADAVVASDMADTLMTALGNIMPGIHGGDVRADAQDPGAAQLRNLGNAFMDDPLGLVAHGFFTNLPSVATTVGGGLIAGPVGAAVGGVVADFPSRLDDVLTDRMRDIGVNVDDPQEVVQYLRWNPEFVTDAVKSAGMGSLTVGVADALLRHLTRPLKPGVGVARNVATATGNVATGVASEAAGEAAARAVAGQDPSLSEVLNEAIGAVGITAGHTAVETAGHIKHERGADRRREDIKKATDAITGASGVLGDLQGRIAENTVQHLDDLIEKSGATKLAGRSPEKLTEFLSTVTGPDQNVFIPAEAVQAYFQSQPVEDMQALSDALGITDQIPEALARGGDVVIPLAKYVTEAGKSDIHKAWREDVRLEADGFSIRQAQEDAKVRDERLKLAVDRFEKQLDAGIAEVDATTRVYEDLHDKLKTAGKFTNEAAEQQAAVFAEHYATRAQRNPNSYTDAWDAWKKAGLGTGMEIRTQLSDRVGAYPPDELDVLLNSIKTGKVAPTKDADANAQFLKDREELAGALSELKLDPRKMSNPQIRAAIKAEVEKRKAGGVSYEQAFKPRAFIEFARNVGEVLANRWNVRNALSLGHTPEALLMVGAPDRQLVIMPAVVTKAVGLTKTQSGDRHAVKEDDIRRLPEMLERPVAIFRSDTQPDAYAVIIEASDANGEPVMVAVHTAGQQVKVNRIASAYGRGQARWYEDQIAKANLLYLDSEKSRRLEKYTGVQFPGSTNLQGTAPTGSAGKIFTEADLVKGRRYEQGAPAIPEAVARQMVDAYNETLETVDEQYTRWASDKAGDSYDRLTLKDLEDQYGDLDEVPAAALDIAREHGAVVVTMEERNAPPEFHVPEDAPSLDEHRESVVREQDGTFPAESLDDIDYTKRLDVHAAFAVLARSMGWEIRGRDKKYFSVVKPLPEGQRPTVDEEEIDEIRVGIRIADHPNTSAVGHAVHGKADVHINIAPGDGMNEAHTLEDAAALLQRASVNDKGEVTFGGRVASLFQEARGQITFTENRSTITLFQGRDLSTLWHETGHVA